MLSSLDLSAGEAWFAAAVLLLASYVRGYSGFGFSAVLVSGLAFVMDPLEAVPVAIAFEVVASIVQARSVWGEIRWRYFWVLLAAAIVGNPIGVWVLTSADQDALRTVTFGMLFVLSIGLLLSSRGGTAPTAALFFGVGVVAGVVNGATAMAGLVLVLAMSFMALSPREMRATLIAYFFASDLVVLAILGARDSIDAALVWRVGIGLPLLGVGILVGSKSFHKASPESFRRATLGLLIAISLVGLARLALG